MKIISDEKQIAQNIKKYGIDEILIDHQVDYRIFRYEKGEFLAAAGRENPYLLIVIKGLVHIYNILEDGSSYSLTLHAEPVVIGDIEFFRPAETSFFVQAETETFCIAVEMRYARKRLADSMPFIHFLARGMADKFTNMAKDDFFTRLTLQERVVNHMRYHCRDYSLKGIEKTASLLRCSSRQLQRVLNKLEQEGAVSKRGKGTYRLMDPDKSSGRSGRKL